MPCIFIEKKTPHAIFVSVPQLAVEGTILKIKLFENLIELVKVIKPSISKKKIHTLANSVLRFLG